MKCPYCKEEMELGYIKSSQRMHWGKEQTLGFLPNDIKLTKGFWEGFFHGYFVDAHHCRHCGKIVISLETN